jgi:hypothetical protein
MTSTDTAQTSSKMHGTMAVLESTVTWQTPALSLNIKPNERCWLTTIAGLEPVVTETLNSLVAQVDKAVSSGTPFNIRRYLNYFTIDLFAEMLYGNSLGCLERGNDIVTAESLDGKVYQVPFVRSLHNATVINTVLGMEAPLLPVTKSSFHGIHMRDSGQTMTTSSITTRSGDYEIPMRRMIFSHNFCRTAKARI